jgi:hypothetical protein
MKDINIHKTEATEIAIPNKITLYVCVYWVNGIMWCNNPSQDKKYQEQYAFGQGKYSDYCTIYKFEIDTPVIGKII